VQLLGAALLKLDITDDQRVDVYRWLAYNYIVLKKEEAAKSATYKLYAVDEGFELPSTESPRFREPFAKWKTQWIEDGKPGQPKPAEKPPATVTIKHLPSGDVGVGMSISVSGTIDDPDKRVARVVVAYRTGSKGKFVELPATLGLGDFRATIPSTAAKPPIVEYYVTALDKGGIPIATRGDADVPLRVVVEAEKEGSILGTWWFWTGTTAVVAGAVLGVFFLTRKSDDSGPGPVVPPGPGSPSTVTITIGE
jgi:hypothetical protein